MASLPPICPRCGQSAPIVYRGVFPFCTACAALRVPLSGPSVNLAGKPSKVGGRFTSVIGWLILVCGGSIVMAIAGVFLALHLAAIGLAIALPIALMVLVAGIALVKSGRSLASSGEAASLATRERAVLALAAHKGAVTAYEAAHSLGLPVAEADALLTTLAKREPDRVAVDVDDHGAVWYRLSPAPGEPVPRPPPWAAAPAAPRVRVDAADEAHEAEPIDEASHSVAPRASR